MERIRREGVSLVLAQWVGVKKENTTEGECEEKEENTIENKGEEKENTTQNEWEEKEENATQNKGDKEETLPPTEELPENGIVTCKAALDALTEQVSFITIQSCADYRREVLDF